MSKERRTAKRFTVVDLDLYSLDPETRVGNVVNLSEGGLLVLTDDEIKLKSTHEFRIPFRETVNGQIDFDFKGKIAWSNRSTLDPANFSTGIQFTENPELQVQFIRQMIKVFGSN